MVNAEAVSGFVLAAGYGTRMGGLTASTPKPLLEACGAPLVAHSLFFLHQMGIRKVVLNLHYLGEQLEERLRGVKSMELKFSYEKIILGTAGGIRFAAEKVEAESLVVVNPDVLLWPAGAYTIGDLDMARGTADALLFVATRAGHETGLCLHPDGTLAFEQNGPDYFVGCSFMRMRVFEQIESGSVAELGNLWRGLADRGKLRGLRFEGHVVDMGSEAAYKRHQGISVPAQSAGAWESFRREFE